ncbi:1725_t:CDS:2, partial [Gigaspora margarita]
MNSNIKILNPKIQIEKSNAYPSSIATDIDSSLTHNKQKNSRLLNYKQDKRVRKELDTQILDDLYEPIQNTFMHTSKFLTPKSVLISSDNNGNFMT